MAHASNASRDRCADTQLITKPHCLQGAQRVPTVGHIVGTLWELRDLVAAAKGNRANCNTLASFGADIMRAFDFQGGHTNCCMWVVNTAVKQPIAACQRCHALAARTT